MTEIGKPAEETSSTLQDAVVYVVDDEKYILDFIQSVLDAAGISTKQFKSGGDFLAQEDISQIGCLLLDNQMPGMSGLEVQAELHKRNIHIPIIFISGKSQYNEVVEAVREGALNFLQKPFTVTTLLEQVRDAIGESKKQLQKLSKSSSNRALLGTLTAREKQVCDLVTSGLTNKLIAEKLDISNGTVEFHRANMMKKLGAKSLADLMEITRGSE